jgi:hypothetical protein
MTQLIRRHPLVTFFILAFGITWVVWVLRAAASQGLLSTDLPSVVGQAWTSSCPYAPSCLRAA